MCAHSKSIQIVAIYDDYGFSSPIEYTFDLILSICGVAYRIIPYGQLNERGYDLDKALVISYGSEYLDTGAKKQIHIYASHLLGEDYLKPSSMPGTPLHRYKSLPIIYSGHGKLDGFVRKSDTLIETNIDIIASSFFMLSRYEEVVQDMKDRHERFPAMASLAYQEGFLDRPIVNEYVELLWSWIRSLMPNLERKPLWPENKEFAVSIGHDVDSLQKYSLLPPAISIGSAIVRQKNFRLALDKILDYLGCVLHLRRDPFDTFDYMMSLEQRYGFVSSFYFLSGGSSKFDASYRIASPKVRSLIQRIEGAGCEVGLHGSYYSYDNLEEMALEKACLDKIVVNQNYGSRQHFLRFGIPETWRIQEEAGLLYDTTLGFADYAGFRCGFCMPFRPFDVPQNRVFDIWEAPLTVMERSLQNPDYQNLPPEAAYEEMMRLVNVVKKFNGVFVLLWHNSSLDSLGGWKGWKDVYEKVMEYLSNQNAWVTSGRGIIDWWKQRLSST